MRGRSWLVGLGLALVLAACVPAVAQRPVMPAVTSGQITWTPKKVTLDLKGVPLDEAIKQVVAATDLSVLITGVVPKEPRVTMRLAESDPMGVLRLLSQAGALDYAESERTSISEPAVVLIAAGEVPYAGRRVTGPRPPQITRGTDEAPAPGLAWNQLMPGAGSVAIDLDLNNTPFRDAVAEIVKQIPANDRAHIVVDDSVPQDIRVTARVRKMNLTWVLDGIVEQAGLTYGQQYHPAPEVPGVMQVPRPGTWTIYIVPKPELRVSGGGK